MSAPTDAASASAAGSVAAAAPSPATSAAAAAPPAEDPLVQYVVMRSDLVKQKKWNVGGLIGNGAHACVSAIVQYMGDGDVAAYTAPDALPNMHKVVLSVPDEAELNATADMLQRSGFKHVLWREQPENYCSCLALKPYRRSVVQPLLRHLKLFR